MADIDNDNHAEMLVTSYEDAAGWGLQAFEDTLDAWMDTRRTWNQHSYHVTNIEENASIPVFERDNWAVYNNYRVNTERPEDYLPDLTMSLIRDDLSDCPNAVRFTVRVGNGSLGDAPAGVPVAMYDGDPGSGGVLIATQPLPAGLAAGEYVDLTFVWSPAPPPGFYDVFFIVDDDTAGPDMVEECDETNNTCAIIEVPVCTCTAAAGTDAMVCQGGSAVLDGSDSVFAGCPGTVEYRWLESTTIIQDWSTTATCTVTPATSATLTMEVRCVVGADVVCQSSDECTVTVEPLPSAAAGPDETVCLNHAFTLDGRASAFPPCTGAREYRWWEGAALLSGWTAAGTLSIPSATLGLHTYRLEVRCGAFPPCVSQDLVDITVEECPTAVDFGEYGAASSSEGIDVHWTTLTEIETLGFVVEGRERADATPCPLHDGIVPARGSGSAYRFVCRAPGPTEFRIREVVAAGPAAATPFFAVDPGTGPPRRLNRVRGATRTGR